MAYDIAAIRKKLRQSQSGKFVDPDEFRPEKAVSTVDATKYRFFILPPIVAGDVLRSGPVKQSMEQFYQPHANHWIHDKPYPCPRVWDGSDCELCSTGFDLLKEIPKEDEDKRTQILKSWMPNTYYMVNIYFPALKMNPEELRGKVKFYNAPKTCFDTWSATLMRENAGDVEDPAAFGVFFDEMAAFMFQLEVIKHGKNNSYKTSRFMADGGIPQPMIKLQNGEPDLASIEKLLAARHNLFDKIEMPNPEKIRQITASILDGDSNEGGFDSDETKPAAAPAARQTAPAARQTAPAARQTTPVKPAAKQVSEDEVVGSPLADEAPLVEAPVKAAPKAAPTAPPKAPPVTAAADNGGDDEIEDLLSQLDDSE